MVYNYRYDEYDDEYGAYEPLDDDTTLWAMLAHLSTLSAWIGVPFGNFLGPLIILLVKGKDHEFIDHNAREALNFQISMFIYGIVAALLILIIIGIPLLLIIIIVDIVCTIKAAIRARNGEYYDYPWSIRIL